MAKTKKTLTVTQPLTVSGDADVRGIVGDWQMALMRRSGSGELAVSTTDTYRRGMSRFLSWCNERKIESVSDDVVRDWISELREDYSPSAINTWLAGVRAFFDWAVGADRLAHNPAIAVKSPKRIGATKRHKRQALTDDEVRRVLALPNTSTAVGVRDRAILALMAYNGARTVEVRRFNIKNVRRDNGRMVIDVRGKARTESDEVLVVCHRDAVNAMHDWMRERKRIGSYRKKGGAWLSREEPKSNWHTQMALFVSLSKRSHRERISLRAIRHIVTSYYKAAGVVGENKTTHSLRHSFASNAARNGAPVQKLQSAMRHANIKDTMIYYHEMDRLTNPAEGFVQFGA